MKYLNIFIAAAIVTFFVLKGLSNDERKELAKTLSDTAKSLKSPISESRTTTQQPSVSPTYSSATSTQQSGSNNRDEIYDTTITVSDVISNINGYSGRQGILACKEISITRSASDVSCYSDKDARISIDTITMRPSQIKYLLDRCIDRECNACVIGRFERVGTHIEVKNAVLKRGAYFGGNSCWPNKDLDLD